MQHLKRSALTLATTLALACSAVKPYSPPNKFSRIGPLGYTKYEIGSVQTTQGEQQCNKAGSRYNLKKGSRIELLGGVYLKIEDISFSKLRGWIITYRVAEDGYGRSANSEPFQAVPKKPYAHGFYGFIFQVDSSDRKNPTVDVTIYGCH